MNTNKSRSTIFKRQSSGHIPLLTSHARPLTNTTNLPILQTNSKRKPDEYETDSIEYDVPTSNYASVRKQQPPSATQTSVKRMKSEQSTTPKKKTLSDDSSLRLVTSTVQGMKHWTTKHLPYPMLFEIFGKLDSQVTSLPSTNTRQFSLIDDNDRLECIYAEMDQSFSTIDRDVQLRVICRLKTGCSVAQCLTIRTATKDEWQERRTVIKQCDIQLNEDDLHAKKMKKSNKK